MIFHLLLISPMFFLFFVFIWIRLFKPDTNFKKTGLDKKHVSNRISGSKYALTCPFGEGSRDDRRKLRWLKLPPLPVMTTLDRERKSKR